MGIENTEFTDTEHDVPEGQSAEPETTAEEGAGVVAVAGYFDAEQESYLHAIRRFGPGASIKARFDAVMFGRPIRRRR